MIDLAIVVAIVVVLAALVLFPEIMGLCAFLFSIRAGVAGQAVSP